ncbi:MAG: leucine-rich repeat protein [Prevotella sp.]|nr:leucine-rich repeat protein [Prevotella sp.]
MRKIYQTLMLCMVLSLPAHAEDIQVNSINYRLYSNGTAMVLPNHFDEGSSGVVIIGLNNGYDGDVVIPETITHNGASYQVTSAYEGTFSNSTKMTSISLPSTLTNLGTMPFTSCNKLTTITVAEGNPTYSSENGALFNKSKNILISCPGGKTGSFEIPSSVTEIARCAFYGCSKLTSITVPPTVQHMGEGAFRACILLTEVNIPDGITRLENSVFRGCSSIKHLTIPSSVTSIGDYAFYYCQNLINLQIQGQVTSIGSYALSSCVKLQTIELPSSVQTMGDRVFESSNKLTSINLPVSLQNLGAASFRGCSMLQAITIPSENTSFCSEDGVLFDKNKERLICCPAQKQGVYEVPSTVKKIDSYAFFMCRYLREVLFPLSLTEIGNSAFANCSSLTTLTLPNSMLRIGKNAFITCTMLGKITCYAMNPPVCTSETFSTSTYDIPLYVPSSTIDSYKNSDEWNQFSDIRPINEMAFAHVDHAFRGAISSVEVNLNNAQTNVSGYSFMLQLPYGISLKTNDNGSPAYQFTNRHSSTGTTLTMSGSHVSGYNITVENGSNVLTGNEGDVLSLLFLVAEGVEEGEYTGRIYSGTITYADGSTASLEDSSFTIKVEEGKLGDVNLDGEVSVIDVTLEVDRVLGKSVDTFYWQLGDVTKDGSITVADVTNIVNIVLGL